MARTSSPASRSQPASRACPVQARPQFELPPPKSDEPTKLQASITAKGVLEPIVVSAGPGCPGAVADARQQIAQTLRLPCPREPRPFESEPEFRLYRLITNPERRRLSSAALVHSAKPEKAYRLIERMYPGLSRVEPFARHRHEGWAAWGNEVAA
jgi:MT-A70 protein